MCHLNARWPANVRDRVRHRLCVKMWYKATAVLCCHKQGHRGSSIPLCRPHVLIPKSETGLTGPKICWVGGSQRGEAYQPSIGRPRAGGHLSGEPRARQALVSCRQLTNVAHQPVSSSDGSGEWARLAVSHRPARGGQQCSGEPETPPSAPRKVPATGS